MSIEYIDLADYIAIAAAVTGLDLRTVMNITNLDLADSALHAPAAGIGNTDFYPEFVDKAAVFVVRLARNTPLARWQQTGGMCVAAPFCRHQRLDLGAEARNRRRRGCGARHRCGRMGRGRRSNLVEAIPSAEYDHRLTAQNCR